jgi:hypothetical protein
MVLAIGAEVSGARLQASATTSHFPKTHRISAPLLLKSSILILASITEVIFTAYWTFCVKLDLESRINEEDPTLLLLPGRDLL